MSDLCNRLRGRYSVGPNGIYEDRDFGSYTPAVCKEAADTIEQLQSRCEELDKKAHELSQFIGCSPIFETIDPAEQERLKEQNDIMWQYSEILGARIAAFGGA
jgi:FtsZ-binding cell division protein ZapB